eukprot:653354-Pelagomonas_calceolata.AAC.1
MEYNCTQLSMEAHAVLAHPVTPLFEGLCGKLLERKDAGLDRIAVHVSTYPVACIPCKCTEMCTYRTQSCRQPRLQHTNPRDCTDFLKLRELTCQ